MRYALLLMLVYGLLLAAPAAAVRLVPGTVPKLEPLQPMPVDVAPNLQHNISPVEALPPAPSAAAPRPPAVSPGALAAPAAAAPSGPPVWLYGLGALVAVGASVGAWARRKQKTRLSAGK